MQRCREKQCCGRAGRSRSPGPVAAPEKGGQPDCEPVHRREPSGRSDVLRGSKPASSNSSSPTVLRSTGVDMTYFSEAQLPRSSMRQRSLQNGMLGSSKGTSFLQIGHRTVAAITFIIRPAGCVGMQLHSRSGKDSRNRNACCMPALAHRPARQPGRNHALR